MSKLKCQLHWLEKKDHFIFSLGIKQNKNLSQYLNINQPYSCLGIQRMISSSPAVKNVSFGPCVLTNGQF